MKISSRTLKFSLALFLMLQFLIISSPITIQAYTPCDGIEDGDTALVEYEGKVQSTNEVFDSTEDSGAVPFTITSDGLIQGFYEGILGMKIDERKIITVPPSKGYTNPNTAPDGLYGETLIFDVYIQTITQGQRPCDDGGSSGGSSVGSIIFNIILGVVGVGFGGWLLLTIYYSLQKQATPGCVHCKTEGRDRLSEGKCGKCGSTFCRQSFSRGCPNCKSNSFVPLKS